MSNPVPTTITTVHLNHCNRQKTVTPSAVFEDSLSNTTTTKTDTKTKKHCTNAFMKSFTLNVVLGLKQRQKRQDV